MSTLLLALYLWVFVELGYVMAYTISCSTVDCERSLINCAPTEDCFVFCTGSHSCANTIINCPSQGNCNIECVGNHACEYTTIDASFSTGNVNLLCDHELDNIIHASEYCKGIKIFGNTLGSVGRTGNFNIQCNGNARSCLQAQIICPANSNCALHCNNDESCKYSYVTGPTNGALNIQCNGAISCYNAIFNAALSATLDIKGCKLYKSCLDLSIYCPPNTNGYKNCYIQGNDNLGKDRPTRRPTTPHPTSYPTTPTLLPTAATLSPSAKPSTMPTSNPSVRPSEPPSTFTDYGGSGITIYAINGWNDIHVDYTGSFGPAHVGKMVCGDNYGNSCDLAKNDWKCDLTKHGINPICDQQIIKNHIGMMPGVQPQPQIAVTTAPTQRPIINSQQQIKTTTPTTMLVVQKSDNNGASHGANSTATNEHYIYVKRSNGDIFIVIGVSIVIITCCAVGYAQMRKNIADAKRLTDAYNEQMSERERLRDKSFEREYEREKDNCLPNFSITKLKSENNERRSSKLSAKSGGSRSGSFNIDPIEL